MHPVKKPCARSVDFTQCRSPEPTRRRPAAGLLELLDGLADHDQQHHSEHDAGGHAHLVVGQLARRGPSRRPHRQPSRVLLGRPPPSIGARVSTSWQAGGEYTDIRYELATGDDAGIAKITINRPEVRNAFRPETVVELADAFTRAREDPAVGVIILTGEGPDAFCSGGDQRVRGSRGGYVTGADPKDAGQQQAVGRFEVTDLHIQMRRLPKPIVAMVAGYAIGGGHVLHVVCDLTIAADNARFGQVGPKVGSFDGGYGASLLSRLVGPKKAKEIWFLCRQYSAEEAREMGMVNTVVPLDELETETVAWCRRMLELSPFALRMMKASFHAEEDGFAGIQQLAHDANLLFYASDEAKEGREAYKAKRRPDFAQFPKRP